MAVNNVTSGKIETAHVHHAHHAHRKGGQGRFVDSEAMKQIIAARTAAGTAPVYQGSGSASRITATNTVTA